LSRWVRFVHLQFVPPAARGSLGAGYPGPGRTARRGTHPQSSRSQEGALEDWRLDQPLVTPPCEWSSPHFAPVPECPSTAFSWRWVFALDFPIASPLLTERGNLFHGAETTQSLLPMASREVCLSKVRWGGVLFRDSLEETKPLTPPARSRHA
jgi:hypothetical protein